MFEARLVNGIVFKQIIEAISNLVNDVNIDCTDGEMAVNCMDSAHVALVAMRLDGSAFDQYRCDRTINLGFNTGNMSKVMKMMGKDDTLSLKAEDDGDELVMMFENEKTGSISDFGTLFCTCTDSMTRF